MRGGFDSLQLLPPGAPMGHRQELEAKRRWIPAAAASVWRSSQLRQSELYFNQMAVPGPEYLQLFVLDRAQLA